MPDIKIIEGTIVFGDPHFGWRIHEKIDTDQIQPFIVDPKFARLETIQPDKVFRGDMVYIDTIRNGIWLASLRTGNIESLIMPVPAHIFDPRYGYQNLGLTLKLPTCDVSSRMTLEFKNTTDEPVSVRAWMVGRSLAK